MKQRRTTTNTLVAAGIVAVLCPLAVTADDDTGPYIAVTANRLSADFEDEDDVSFDESDTTGGVAVGYMFTDMFGIEAGYLDLGDYEAEGDSPDTAISLDGDAYRLAFVLNFSPLDQLDVYGKVGAYRLDVDSTSTVAGFRLREGQEETEAFGALGAEYDLGALNLFGEISIVDTDINDLSIDVVSIGVKYEFGNVYQR